MKIHLKLHGTLPDHYQGPYSDSGLIFEFNDAVSVAELVDYVGLPRKRIGLVSINGRLAKAGDLIPDGATVKFLQSIAGG